MVIRQRCMDYMQAEAAFFLPFVVGMNEDADFVEYIRTKRRDAAVAGSVAWGDEPELQAICEIYDRRAEVHFRFSS